MKKPCRLCDETAVARVAQTLGDGGYGVRTATYLCAEHLAYLVRNSTRRYEIHEIVRRTNAPPDRPAISSPGLFEVTP